MLQQIGRRTFPCTDRGTSAPSAGDNADEKKNTETGCSVTDASLYLLLIALWFGESSNEGADKQSSIVGTGAPAERSSTRPVNTCSQIFLFMSHYMSTVAR